MGMMLPERRSVEADSRASQCVRRSPWSRRGVAVLVGSRPEPASESGESIGLPRQKVTRPRIAVPITTADPDQNMTSGPGRLSNAPVSFQPGPTTALRFRIDESAPDGPTVRRLNLRRQYTQQCSAVVGCRWLTSTPTPWSAVRVPFTTHTRCPRPTRRNNLY